jgi:hypothetical protein
VSTSARRAARRTAREAESSTPLRALARAGYAGDGFVHLLIGVIVLVVTFGGDGESDQTGAFKAVAAAPLGFVALWTLAVVLWALALYHVLEVVLARGENAMKKWARRASESGQALVFATLGVISAIVATGAQPNGEQTVESASGTLLAVPGGSWVLAAVGIGIAIGGVVFAFFGVTRRFRQHTTIPPGPLGAAVSTLGVAGYAAKGAALAIVGVLLVVAAATLDREVAGGMDGAAHALVRLPYGPWLGAAVGVGVIAYGFFLFARARYTRL